MAVGDMMDHLAHRPAALAIPGLQLIAGEIFDGQAQLPGQLAQGFKSESALCRGKRLGPREAANWVAKVVDGQGRRVQAGTSPLFLPLFCSRFIPWERRRSSLCAPAL